MSVERFSVWSSLLQSISRRFGEDRTPSSLGKISREVLLTHEQSSENYDTIDATVAMTLLEQMSLRLSWQTQQLVFSPEELLTLPELSFPLFAWRKGHSHPWVGILKSEGGKLETFFPGSGNQKSDLGYEKSYFTVEELTQLLGLDSSATPMSWMLIEPGLPMHGLHSTHEANTPGEQALHRFRRLLLSEKSDILVIFSYSLVIGLLSLTTPIVVQALVNSVAFGALLQPLVMLSILLAAGLSFSALLQGFRTVVVELMLRRVFVKVCLDFAYRLPRVAYGPFQNRGGAELVNRFFDVIKLQKTLSVLLFDGISAALQLTVGLLLLAMYHPVLLVLDIVLIVCLLVILRVLGRKAIDTSIKESKVKYKVAAWLEEIARNPMTFKAFGAPVFAVEHAEHLAQEYIQSRHKHFKILFRQILGAFGLQVIASVLLLLVGGWLVLQRQLTLGQLVAAELVLATMLSSIGKMGKLFENFYDLMSSLDKLGQVVDLPLENSQGEELPHKPNGIHLQVKGLRFQYKNAEKPLFKGLDMDLSPGSKVALWGRAGSGKSTLLELFFGLRRFGQGQLLLDGLELRELQLESLRREVVAIHHVEILEASILDNIIMGRPTLSRRDAREALRTVGLLDDVLQLPNQLETKLKAQGTQLSKSQRIRLVLARAIVGEPRLLLLDSFLDVLDDDVREEFIKILTSDDAPWTLLMVTQDPDWWAACDYVLTLRQGMLEKMSVQGGEQ